MTEKLTFTTVSQDGSLPEKMEQLSRRSWPEFMLHASGGGAFWSRLYSDFPDYQFGVYDPHRSLVAAGWSLPLRFDGAPDELPDEGWDWAMIAGFEGLAQETAPNILSAIAIVVNPELRGQQLSRALVEHMKQIGQSGRVRALIAPVRPTLKASYPLIPMREYIRWTSDEQLPFDPWMRVHARLGARTMKPCNHAMQIYGTVDEWQTWTGLKFPASGRYVVPGALVPVEIDCDSNRGTYIEPNVWMWHDIDAV